MNLFQKYVSAPIRAQLLQGISPEKLALSCAFGVAFGSFPILGATTLLCLAAGVVFKLNQPTLQAVNYLMSPLQLATIPLFIKYGDRLVGGPGIEIHPQTIAAEFTADIPAFFAKYGMYGLQGIFAWSIVAPFLGVGVYFACREAFRRFEARRLA